MLVLMQVLRFRSFIDKVFAKSMSEAQDVLAALLLATRHYDDLTLEQSRPIGEMTSRRTFAGKATSEKTSGKTMDQFLT